MNAMSEKSVIDHLNERYLSLKEVMGRYGVKRATVYNWEKQGRFPTRCKLGKSTRWILSELVNWEQSLKRGNGNAQEPAQTQA